MFFWVKMYPTVFQSCTPCAPFVCDVVCIGPSVYVLCSDWLAPFFLDLCSLVLGIGPRLDLPAAKYGVDESPPHVDPRCHPEHLHPARHGVLTTTEEEMHHQMYSNTTTNYLCSVTYSNYHNSTITRL